MKFGVKANFEEDYYLANSGFTSNKDKAIEFDSFSDAEDYIKNEMSSTSKYFSIVRFV